MADPETTILDAVDTSWKESLSEEFADVPLIKEAGDLNSFVKSAIATKALVGAKELTVPTKDSAPEEWDAFHSAIGRPDTPAEYELPADGLPEGMELDSENFQDWYKEFHQTGAPKKAVASYIRKMANDAHEARVAADQDFKAAGAKASKDLKLMLGKGYDEGIEIIKSLAQEGGEKVEAFFKSTVPVIPSHHPEFMKMIVDLGKSIGQDEVVGRGRNAAFVKSPAEATAAISAKQLDKDFMRAYTTSHDPGHAAAVEEMNALYAHAYPGG